ncbi:hypothetical protein QUR00_004345 [Escherichia coli]|nr:hypothetical protein [Escherichia coli]
MKKYILIMAIIYTPQSNSTTCDVSGIKWKYNIQNSSTGAMRGEGEKTLGWSNSTFNLEPDTVIFGETFAATNTGSLVLTKLPSFSVYPVLLRDYGYVPLKGYSPGVTSGKWGTYQGPSSLSRGIRLSLTLSDDNPQIEIPGNCGDWVTGLTMKTEIYLKESGYTSRYTYNSIFDFQTVSRTKNININLSPDVINMTCTISQDCITKSTLNINNPSNWSGKMYVTYPAIEGVQYKQYNNWVEQVVDFHLIGANISSSFTQSIKLSGKKPGTKVFSIPIQVELV